MHRELKQVNNNGDKSEKEGSCQYENTSEELAAAFAEKYPKGFSDYLPDLIKYDKPDGTASMLFPLRFLMPYIW